MANGSFTGKLSYDQCYFIGSPADYTKNFKQTYVSLAVVNALIAAPTIFGNFVIILAVWITPALHNVSNLLLAGLACSDLGVGLIVPALNIARIVSKLHNNAFNHWCQIQVAYTFFGVMFCGVSFLTVAAFTIDKSLALHWHLRYASIVTSRRAVYLMVVIWAVFGAMSTLQIWSMTAYRISVCIVVPLFLLGTSFTYLNIYRVLHRHQLQIQSQSLNVFGSHSNSNPGSGIQALNLARYRKSLTGMFTVYCLFIFCYLPYICVQVSTIVLNMIDSSHDNARLYLAVDVTETIVIFNSLLNPVIYCWRMRDIRQAASMVLLILRGKTAVQPISFMDGTSRTWRDASVTIKNDR
ncbi:predicted protein [Nematostella vectensis]|uniref:G-protein coupled receptors family 1 profile domain-containing protein n=1 Tax=Nematostella vectensis TaxID=45351 RepID=A7SYD4_NEMVE|nr:beta-2 adrenergic receptor [Nematostella vectensis]EDO31282.1 predicted protein [Nematostella vectensis]|eukprot:XP_001623382.1 predicted protein [Nematostella vectensis]